MMTVIVLFVVIIIGLQLLQLRRSRTMLAGLEALTAAAAQLAEVEGQVISFIQALESQVADLKAQAGEDAAVQAQADKIASIVADFCNVIAPATAAVPVTTEPAVPTEPVAGV